MTWLGNVLAWCALIWRMRDPPALFHHLHGLNWYRQAVWDTLPHREESPANARLAGQSVLELGCAGGDFCADIAAQGANVHGIDRSTEMVRRATLAHSTVQFQQADALALPFESAQFDIVFAASLLNVVSDPARVLREMARVCRPGGTLALLVPAAGFSKSQAQQWVTAQGYTSKEAAGYFAWNQLAKKVDAAQLSEWLSAAGLGNARVEQRLLLGGLVWSLQVYPPHGNKCSSDASTKGTGS